MLPGRLRARDHCGPPLQPGGDLFLGPGETWPALISHAHWFWQFAGGHEVVDLRLRDAGALTHASEALKHDSRLCHGR